jgi:hypothetical protein
VRRAVLFAVAAFSFISCSRKPYGTVVHRRPDGVPDQWIYRTDRNTYNIFIDTNGDGWPDVVKTFRSEGISQVERDRNHDHRVDLVQEYANGILLREVHDDDFDGKPEMIEHFRHGRLAIVERDPEERGYVDIVEYYDDSGKLIHRQVRTREPRPTS